MANSSWFQITNRCLALGSMDLIESELAFNDVGQGQLEKYQGACKEAISLSHDLLSLRSRQHFASRRIPLPLQIGVKDYAIDTGLDPENIKLESFYNVTATAGLSAKNGPLRFLEYKQWLRIYPDPNNIPTGAPECWTLLPIERTEATPLHKVRITPTPDAAYNLEFQAKINAQPLTQATDLIIFPRHYEAPLLLFARELTETEMGEGKEGRIAQLAERAANQVFLISGKPQDQRRAPRGMRIRTMGRGARAYDSPRSVDPNTGSVLD